MTTAQVVETSVTVNNNSPIQDCVHPDDQTQPTFEILYYYQLLACEQALGVLWQHGGKKKDSELATTSLEFEFHSNSPVAPHGLSCQISANQREAEMSANINNKHFTLTF